MTLDTQRLKLWSPYTFLIGCILFMPACKKHSLPVKESSDPVSVFTNFWETMDTRYALFNEKKINWDSVYTATLPRISGNITSDQLFTTISSCLNLLQDGHLGLFSATKTYNFDNFYTLYPKNFNYQNLLANYLKNEYVNIGPTQFKIVDSVGYLYYGNFRENLTLENLNTLADSLRKTKSLIVDVRNNTGGYVANAQLLASLLLQEKTLVKYEVYKSGPGHSEFKPGLPFYLNPGSSTYLKPIALLTNRACYSACNDFVLYLLNRKNTTQIGDQTGGGGAIPLKYLLPNGWILQYSASKTLAPNLEPVENGINPDLYITITAIQDLQGIDPILEKAFQILK